MRTRRVLVIGASGFVGSHVMRAFRATREECEVIGSGRGGRPGSSGAWRPIDLLAPAAEVVSQLAVVQPAVIVNCSGATAGSATNLTLSNVVTMATLLDAVCSLPCRPRLVHLGSAAEYGAVRHGTAVAEDYPASPVSPYGVSKLAATQLMSNAADAGEIDGIVLRVFNAIGPRMPTDSLPGAFCLSLRDAIAANASSVAVGPLDSYRDFVDVRDVAAAVVAGSFGRGPLPRVVNIGSGRAVPLRSVVLSLVKLSGFNGAVEERGRRSSRSAAVAWQQADIAAAGKALGWLPRFGLAEAVDSVWQGST